jgi:adenosine 3'-phospho 5'-phosphosulfate transporter B3
MLFGLVVMGKRYSNIDYVCVLFMVLGLVAFIHADLKATPSFDVTGLILIALALAADAALLNFQEHCMQVPNHPCPNFRA